VATRDSYRLAPTAAGDHVGGCDLKPPRHHATDLR
jgi:hypothetical protein